MTSNIYYLLYCIYEYAKKSFERTLIIIVKFFFYSIKFQINYLLFNSMNLYVNENSMIFKSFNEYSCIKCGLFSFNGNEFESNCFLLQILLSNHIINRSNYLTEHADTNNLRRQLKFVKQRWHNVVWIPFDIFTAHKMSALHHI